MYKPAAYCILIISFVFLINNKMFSKEYFVSEKGKDSNKGTISAPFRTLQRFIDLMQSGDKCFIREGRYIEPVKISNHKAAQGGPIIIQSYNGEKVVLDGSIPVKTKWKRYKNKIYKTRLKQDIRQVFVNDKMIPMARWPNADVHDGSVWNIWASRRHQAPQSTFGHMFDENPGDSKSDFVHDEGYRKVIADKKLNKITLAQTGIDFTGAIAVLNIGSWLSWAQIVEKHKAGSDNFTYSTDFSKSGKFMMKAATVTINRPEFFKKKKFQGYYYLTGLMCIDKDNEWWYDKDKKELYLYAPGGVNPSELEVRGKQLDYSIKATNCSYIEFRDLSFFSSTFQFFDCDHMIIENCGFLYPSYNKLVLHDFRPTEEGSATMITNAMGVPSTNIIRNCIFEYMDGPGLFIKGGSGNIVENCYIHDIDWTCLSTGGNGAINAYRSDKLTFRRNTVHTGGSSEGVRVGNTNTIEFNNIYNLGLIEHDGSVLNVGVHQQEESIIRYNWCHDSMKQGIRFDAINPKLFKHYYGKRGTIHHNVVWNVNMNQIKGDDHRIYNNVFYDGHKRNLGIISSDRHGGINKKSIIRNNLVEDIYTQWWKPQDKQPPVPGITDHNHVGDIRKQLRDPDNYDFRPLKNSLLIDKGKLIDKQDIIVRKKSTRNKLSYLKNDKTNPGFYIGDKPDIGAYENNDAEYWIPGYQFKHASTPVPPNKAINVKIDADLMWLKGYNAISSDVYFGTGRKDVESADHSSNEYKGNYKNNIFKPEKLQKGKIYYWRVDTIIKDKVVTGETWAFNVSD